MIERIKELLAAEAAAIQNIPLAVHFEQALDLIHAAVHQNKAKLVCSGMGKAGQIANNIATTFSSTGTPAVFLHPSDAQHGDLGILQPGDCLLLISNSGKTREILELVDLCRKMNGKLPIVAITGNPYSEISRHANVVIPTGRPEEICPLGLTPTTSTTTMTVIGDILVVLMMEKIGFSAQDYARRHHGGYLGEKSRNTGR